MLHFKIFILECTSVNRFASFAIPMSDVTTCERQSRHFGIDWIPTTRLDTETKIANAATYLES